MPRLEVQSSTNPRDGATMPEVIEIVSDSEEERV